MSPKILPSPPLRSAALLSHQTSSSFASSLFSSAVASTPSRPLPGRLDKGQRATHAHISTSPTTTDQRTNRRSPGVQEFRLNWRLIPGDEVQRAANQVSLCSCKSPLLSSLCLRSYPPPPVFRQQGEGGGRGGETTVPSSDNRRREVGERAPIVGLFLPCFQRHAGTLAWRRYFWGPLAVAARGGVGRGGVGLGGRITSISLHERREPLGLLTATYCHGRRRTMAACVLRRGPRVTTLILLLCLLATYLF